MTVSVMITTKDRVSDLRRTCCALRKLKPPPLEVLITIDGSTENVLEAVDAELPQARVFVNQIGLGSVASRDRMLREARGDLVLALDDDSYPEQLDCIARIVPLFEQRPNTGGAPFSPAHRRVPRNTRANELRLRTFNAFVC